MERFLLQGDRFFLQETFGLRLTKGDGIPGQIAAEQAVFLAAADRVRHRFEFGKKRIEHRIALGHLGWFHFTAIIQ